mgnify:CR=1 FL=1
MGHTLYVREPRQITLTQTHRWEEEINTKIRQNKKETLQELQLQSKYLHLIHSFSCSLELTQIDNFKEMTYFLIFGKFVHHLITIDLTKIKENVFFRNCEKVGMKDENWQTKSPACHAMSLPAFVYTKEGCFDKAKARFSVIKWKVMPSISHRMCFLHFLVAHNKAS